MHAQFRRSFSRPFEAPVTGEEKEKRRREEEKKRHLTLSSRDILWRRREEGSGGQSSLTNLFRILFERSSLTTASPTILPQPNILFFHGSVNKHLRGCLAAAAAARAVQHSSTTVQSCAKANPPWLISLRTFCRPGFSSSSSSERTSHVTRFRA